ncbi:MAG: glucosamine-6-phosphate isomerase [Bacteroidetes bacterium]|nr:glucosamine-6-phosphate isomerase [Bacteroidota bacterium]
MNHRFTKVEQAFIEHQKMGKNNARIPYITVNNFPQLGLLTSLRFLEWVNNNPEGVISLPTGKTPEHFIKWTRHLLENWNTKSVDSIKDKYGLDCSKKPDLKGLQFVQIDEFYPISSKQHNSFNFYVRDFYIKGFGLDEKRALLINAEDITLYEGKSYQEVFPDLQIDLRLRYKDCQSKQEIIQQKSIYKIDQWCSDYEWKIQEKGGIGFFLGGIGPDGHIAFNVRGSDHNSTTRLTATNFETQAVAAGDLGGIEISRNRLVITIGLKTITRNPDVVAIIIAAGEAKAGIIKEALENPPSNMLPATVLQKVKNSRFYITKGAGIKLQDSLNNYYLKSSWTKEKTQRVIIDLCLSLDKFGRDITLEDMKNDQYASLIPNLDENTVTTVIEQMKSRIDLGLEKKKNQTFFHTGPHHDDIMLGLFPEVIQQLRQISNQFNFVILTSGFTAVTNSFVIQSLNNVKSCLDNETIEMITYPDFYKKGFKYKWDKDVYHYLNKIASGEAHEILRGASHRIVRILVEIYNIKNTAGLKAKIDEIIHLLQNSYEGEKDPPKIQKLKGMMREFEEELVWAHYGVQVKNVHHLRLGFYTGDIFTEEPERKRDIMPILEMLRKIKPDVLSVVLDPEGSGPDTHYKVLQAISEALRIWRDEEDISKLRIIGYRNVWYRFHPAEADVIVPVSLNSLQIFNESFRHCYLSQVNASFPSYMHDGIFSELAKKIWTEQYESIRLLLGKSYFYESENPKLRATHGLIFYKEMDVDTFLLQARELKETMEGSIGFQV